MEFTVMLANALKLEGTGSALPFTDNDQIGAWAKQSIGQSVETGIVEGYTDGSFRTNARISRSEIALMLARALNLSIEANAATGFVDDAAIPWWAKGEVHALAAAGIVNGRGGNRFAPKEFTTRAEAAVLLLRMQEAKQPI